MPTPAPPDLIAPWFGALRVRPARALQTACTVNRVVLGASNGSGGSAAAGCFLAPGGYVCWWWTAGQRATSNFSCADGMELRPARFDFWLPVGADAVTTGSSLVYSHVDAACII